MLKTAEDLLFLCVFFFFAYFPARYPSAPAGIADVRGSAGSEGLMWAKMKG